MRVYRDTVTTVGSRTRAFKIHAYNIQHTSAHTYRVTKVGFTTRAILSLHTHLKLTVFRSAARSSSLKLGFAFFATSVAFVLHLVLRAVSSASTVVSP